MNETTLPDPLVPAEVDCTDLDGFMLNVERLMASELVALSSHEVIGAALLLWCRAWKQLPAASLPNDDKVMAAFARMPIARFRKVRDEVLRGFVPCSDGRLYHTTLAREALNAYARKTAFQRKRKADAERLKQWRSGTRGETAHETRDETRFVAEGQGQGQGQGQGHKEKEGEVVVVAGESAEHGKTTPAADASATKPKADRGSRLEQGWELPHLWGVWALTEFPQWTPEKIRRTADGFRDYWSAKAGKDASKRDWAATWRNWCRNDIAHRGDPRPSGKHAGFEAKDYREGVNADGTLA